MFWGRSEQENGKNHAVGVRREKANQKTHLESLLRSPRAETGRGSREVSWKTHGVGVGREKQAEPPTLEAYHTASQQKLGLRVGKQAEKTTMWVSGAGKRARKPQNEVK